MYNLRSSVTSRNFSKSKFETFSILKSKNCIPVATTTRIFYNIPLQSIGLTRAYKFAILLVFLTNFMVDTNRREWTRKDTHGLRKSYEYLSSFLKFHLSIISDVLEWNFKSIKTLIICQVLMMFNSGLKILGFVNTGVPVRFRPEAPLPNKSNTYENSLNLYFRLKKSHKESIGATCDDTMTPLKLAGL